MCERFEPPPVWEPVPKALRTRDRPAKTVGTDKSTRDQSLKPVGPPVPGVPTENGKAGNGTADLERDTARAAWEERAAIIEFESGLGRTQAEAQASVELG
jgi:hypothetical protein